MTYLVTRRRLCKRQSITILWQPVCTSGDSANGPWRWRADNLHIWVVICNLVTRQTRPATPGLYGCILLGFIEPDVLAPQNTNSPSSEPWRIFFNQMYCNNSNLMDATRCAVLSYWNLSRGGFPHLLTSNLSISCSSLDKKSGSWELWRTKFECYIYVLIYLHKSIIIWVAAVSIQFLIYIFLEKVGPVISFRAEHFPTALFIPPFLCNH